MKTQIKVAYFYFITGLLLCFYSMISPIKHSWNIQDSYYVVENKDFAIVVLVIYFFLGSVFHSINKYFGFRVKFVQFLLFTLPFGYDMYVDSTNLHNSVNDLSNPQSIKLFESYLPAIAFFTFLFSILYLLILIGIVVWKKINRPAQNNPFNS